ncbi:MAG: T9SS type A sorting domain-containing protein [Ignavibacteriaceae bacterium]
MKKIILLFAILIGSHYFVWANPIDGAPVTIFSELVFGSNNNWTMEIYFPFGYDKSIDSVVFDVSNIKAKLKVSYSEGTQIGVITSDSLTTPLNINQDGDRIIIYTYSTNLNDPTIKIVRADSLIFGDYPGATVGQPVMGYSIIRIWTSIYSDYGVLNCLTKNPSLGSVNDTVGLSGTMKGHIYDMNKNLITNLSGNYSLGLEDILSINSDGSYTTKIFPTPLKADHLFANYDNLEVFSGQIKIEPFELNDIQPDTIVAQDINLIDSCSFCAILDAIKNYNTLKSNELTLINYPNPFNLSTNFYIKIPNNLKGKPGSINIYNVNGQLLRTIPVSGSSTMSWDSKDMNGRIVPSGIYYYRLVIDSQAMKNGSMILLK